MNLDAQCHALCLSQSVRGCVHSYEKGHSVILKLHFIFKHAKVVDLQKQMHLHGVNASGRVWVSNKQVFQDDSLTETILSRQISEGVLA